MINRKCEMCPEEFRISPSEKRRFCSRKCCGQTKREEKSQFWLGDDVGIDGVHSWVYKHKGRPEECVDCGKKASDGYMIHWSNVDHEYRRVLDDYTERCASCHKKYDLTYLM